MYIYIYIYNAERRQRCVNISSSSYGKPNKQPARRYVMGVCVHEYICMRVCTMYVYVYKFNLFATFQSRVTANRTNDQRIGRMDVVFMSHKYTLYIRALVVAVTRIWNVSYMWYPYLEIYSVHTGNTRPTHRYAVVCGCMCLYIFVHIYNIYV